MFLSLHHVQDRASAARDIGRVLAPGGRLLIRSAFADRLPELDWHRYFERARAIELEMFPALSTVEETFAAEGFRKVALDGVKVITAENFTEYAHRLKKTFDLHILTPIRS